MNTEFINDAYTTVGLRLPMIHYISNSKDICVIFIHRMTLDLFMNIIEDIQLKMIF